MRPINLDDWLRGEAFRYAIEQAFYFLPGETRDGRRDAKESARYVLDHFDKFVDRAKKSQMYNGYWLYSKQVTKAGIECNTRMLGGYQVFVTWTEIRDLLIKCFENDESMGEQISLADIMSAGFYREAGRD